MLPTAIIDLEKGAVFVCCFAVVYQLRLRHACELAIVLLLPLFVINAGKTDVLFSIVPVLSLSWQNSAQLSLRIESTFAKEMCCDICNECV
jgi:hypothetical protein